MLDTYRIRAYRPRMASPSPYLNPKEVASLLDLHVMTVYTLMRQKKLPAVKLGGKWRVHRDRMESYLFGRMGK